MSEIDYSNAPWPVRENFAASHNRYWQRLAAPGTWFTGAERVDMAREIRQSQQCGLCRRRKQALSPYTVDGTHDTVTDLPDVVIEVIHRVTTDSERLTKSWFDGIMQQGLRVEEYIEIIGTLVSVFTIDEFCRCLGLPWHELPEPQPGEPSRYRPPNAAPDDTWVPILPIRVDTGPDADLWEGEMRGYVIRALSLVPDEVRNLLDSLDAHYLSVHDIWNMTKPPQGTLSRAQTELVAARVSALNGCFY